MFLGHFSLCDVILILVTSLVKSEMAPYLKINVMEWLFTVQSFMILGKSAHFFHISAVLYRRSSRITVNKVTFECFVQGQYTLAEKCFSGNEKYIPPMSDSSV